MRANTVVYKEGMTLEVHDAPVASRAMERHVVLNELTARTDAPRLHLAEQRNKRALLRLNLL